MDGAERKLRQEEAAHEATREELEAARAELDSLLQEKRILEQEVEGKISAATVAIAAEMKLKEKVRWRMILPKGLAEIRAKCDS